MIKIEVQDACAVCVQPQLLTTGMVGAVVEFSFDEAWDGLTRCAVFADGMVAKDVLLSGNTCVIPHEVLTTSGHVLCVGVYGTNAAGDVAIPTVYAEVGMIRPGADPTGDESYPPAPSVAAQLQERIEALEESAGQGGIGGKTPEKGVDYWTEEDKVEIVQEVLAQLPAWTGGSY